jgi:hypothetical protein
MATSTKQSNKMLGIDLSTVDATSRRDLSTNCQHVKIAICSIRVQFAIEQSADQQWHCVTILPSCRQRNTRFNVKVFFFKLQL